MDTIRWFSIDGYEVTKVKTVITGYARRYEAEYRGSMEIPAIIVFYQTKEGNALLKKFLKRQKVVQNGMGDTIKTWGDALCAVVGTKVSVPNTMVRWME